MDFKRLRASMIDTELACALNYLFRQLSTRFRDRSEEDFKKVLHKQNNFAIGAFVGHTLIGTASIHFTEDLLEITAAIKNVVTDKHWQRKGTGKKIHEFLLREAKKRNAKFIELTSRNQRVDALAFYENLGYKETERHYLRLYL